MRVWIYLLLFVGPSLGVARAGRPLTIMDYFSGDVRPGDVVCEVIQLEQGQTRCYLTTTTRVTLSENNDPSGALKKGALTPDQRQFTRVQIEQLIAELERGEIKPQGPIDVYVKVKWEARDSGPLAKGLGDDHIVHGRLILSDTGVFQFEVLNIPDMILLGMYNPSLDVAEVFGRRIGAENAEIQADMKRWLEAVLTAVISQVPLAPRR